MEMLCAGAGGEQIGNKMQDASENINSVGGQDGAYGGGTVGGFSAPTEHFIQTSKKTLNPFFLLPLQQAFPEHLVEAEHATGAQDQG